MARAAVGTLAPFELRRWILGAPTPASHPGTGAQYPPSLRDSGIRLRSCAPMYIPTKTPRKLDRKRSKLLRSKFKAKNRNRREGLKK